MARLLTIRFGLAALLAVALVSPASAREAGSARVESTLVAFNSDEGLVRLARSSAKVDFAALANQYEAQINAMFCGPTTAAVVLNAVQSHRNNLPRDRSRLHVDDLKHLSGGDPLIPRYTQDNVIKGPKTRAQVMGEPMLVNGKPERDFGFQLRQFDAMLVANGVRTRLVIVDDGKSEEQIRADLVDNLQRRGDYVAVNYHRKAAGQRGGGHISPLAAYDASSDSFLVLDVNPASNGWVWMPTTALVKGMRTFDTVENRGYLHVMP